jgi:NADH-quinone oxidoreductase subunit J
MEWVVFVICATAAVAGALGVVLAKEPVHSALFLVLTLFCVAVFFVLQEAHFLAAVQVIVYAGAVVILFLFVIMLLGVDEADDLADEPLRLQRWIAGAAGLAVFMGLLLVVRVMEPTGGSAARGSTTTGGESNVARLARSLYTDFLWPFEITSALLVIAVVGAVVLVKTNKPADPGAPELAALVERGVPEETAEQP